MHKPINVGRYIMFDSPITVMLTVNGRGADTWFRWHRGGFITMQIPREDVWSKTVQCATHEVMETAFLLRHCHWKPCTVLSNDATDAYLFHEFTEICDNAGDMLQALLPDLSKAWREWEAKPKRQKRRTNRRAR